MYLSKDVMCVTASKNLFPVYNSFCVINLVRNPGMEESSQSDKEFEWDHLNIEKKHELCG